MGYTHYWYQPVDKTFTDEEWSDITSTALKIIADAADDGIAIAGWDGHGEPVIDLNEIRLNGAKGGGYESFILARTPDPRYIAPGETEAFSFCKTGQAAYDPVVVSILAAARAIAPDKIRVASDGGDEAIKRVY